MEEEKKQVIEMNENNESAKEQLLQEWNIDSEKLELIEKENLWKERSGLTEESLGGAIEALIYMSDRPLNIQKIKKAIDADIPLRLIQSEVEKIQARLEAPEHGMRLVEVAQGYQLRTKVAYSKILQNLYKAPVISLSPLALEVLAIITFKQPISKLDIDQMRGVDSAHLIRGLIDKALVKVAGKSNEAGRLATYGTTRDFLELFELSELDELPSMGELMELVEQNSVGDIEDIRELVKVDKEKFMFDEIEELDRIQQQVRAIRTGTEFTDELKQESKKKSKDEESKTGFELLEDFVEKTEPVLLENENELQELSPETTEQEPVEIEAKEETLETQEQQLFSDPEELERLLDNAFDDIKSSQDFFSEGEDEENLHMDEIKRVQEALGAVENTESEDD